jgi:hypothetical protein
MHRPSAPTVADIARLWWPLALSFELMMMEGPSVQAAIGRLPDIALNLAAWGLTMSLSLLVESPVIMLLATAIALVKDERAYYALRRFTLTLVGFCTILTGAVAFTPLFDIVAKKVMGQPAPIVAAARPAMQIMLLWTAAIGWRRFHQGILVGHQRTHLVSKGTAVRLAATVLAAYAGVRYGKLPGVQVCAIAIMIAVVAESMITTAFVMPILKRVVFKAPWGRPLSQRDIFWFHAPLAATTLLTLLSMPLTATALARLDSRNDTLAAAPVAFMVLLVMRGWGFAIQEIAVAQAGRSEARAALQNFAILVGLVTTAATIIIAATPMLDLYLGSVLKVPSHLWGYIRVGIAIGCLLPLVTSIGSLQRGLLVSSGRTKQVYYAMGANLGSHVLMLTVGVALRLPGMLVASGAFTMASLVELLVLTRLANAHHPATHATQPEFCEDLGIPAEAES